MFKSFEDLEVWKKGREIRISTSTTAKRFPKEETYKLTDQVIRSSRSICANISEGHGRFHFQENIQFCRIARGSLYETLDHFICAEEEKYISQKELEEFREKFSICLKLLNGYIKYLKNQKEKTKST